MDLFSRYLFRQAGGTIMLILLTLTMIVWIATALKQLELLTTKNQDFWMFFKVTLLVLPSLIAIIAPVALIISVIYVLNRVNQDSELVIMTASGSTIWRFARPFMALGIIITAVLYFSNIFLTPFSARLLKQYITDIRTDLISSALQPGKFSRFSGKTTIHIRDRGPDGIIFGLVIHDTSDADQNTTIMSKSGKVFKKGKSAFMAMKNGHILRRVKGTDEVELIAFDSYIFDLTNMGKKKTQLQYKPRESYLHELISPDQENRHFKRSPGKFRAELHDRITNPLYPISFVLIIMAFIGFAKTTRTGRLNAVLIAFVSCVLLRVGGIAATNLLVTNSWAVILVYALPITGALVGALIIHIRLNPSQWPLLRNIATS